MRPGRAIQSEAEKSRFESVRLERNLGQNIWLTIQPELKQKPKNLEMVNFFSSKPLR